MLDCWMQAHMFQEQNLLVKSKTYNNQIVLKIYISYII